LAMKCDWIDELPWPGWLPLHSGERQLIEACAREPTAFSNSKLAMILATLESKDLIRRIETHEVHIRYVYLATDKGRRALEIANLMKRLGIVRQRKPIARFPDNDLVELLTRLRETDGERRLTEGSIDQGLP
jgi:DNA-binding PadR family transcriptional regulator